MSPRVTLVEKAWHHIGSGHSLFNTVSPLLHLLSQGELPLPTMWRCSGILRTDLGYENKENFSDVEEQNLSIKPNRTGQDFRFETYFRKVLLSLPAFDSCFLQVLNVLKKDGTMELCWVKIPYLLSKTKLTTFARHMLSQMAQGEVAGRLTISYVSWNDRKRKGMKGSCCFCLYPTVSYS